MPRPDYSIYYRVVLFALQPVIALSVAMLPYAARRFGERDLEGIRNGLRQGLLVSSLYSLVLLGPLMLWLAPWLADRLAESALTAQYTRFALYLVPLVCLGGSPFLLCRPVFEAMDRGTPGLAMAGLRYVVLSAPLAWSGLHVAGAFDQAPLYGLILGLLVAGTVSSLVFYLWLLAGLTRLRAGSAPGPADE